MKFEDLMKEVEDNIRYLAYSYETLPEHDRDTLYQDMVIKVWEISKKYDYPKERMLRIIRTSLKNYVNKVIKDKRKFKRDMEEYSLVAPITVDKNPEKAFALNLFKQKLKNKLKGKHMKKLCDAMLNSPKELDNLQGLYVLRGKCKKRAKNGKGSRGKRTLEYPHDVYAQYIGKSPVVTFRYIQKIKETAFDLLREVSLG